jgi:hypothetical protein
MEINVGTAPRAERTESLFNRLTTNRTRLSTAGLTKVTHEPNMVTTNPENRGHGKKTTPATWRVSMHLVRICVRHSAHRDARCQNDPALEGIEPSEVDRIALTRE